MNEQAGPACALSVLIVGVFAVLLHDKSSDSSPPVNSPSSISRDSTDPSPTKLEAPPASSRLETTLVAPAPRDAGPVEHSGPVTASNVQEEARFEVGSCSPKIVSDDPAMSPASVPESGLPIRRPSGGFTLVQAGETLFDVASRVYGSGQAAESLWKANRDQLASLGSPLERGTLLRTP